MMTQADLDKSLQEMMERKEIAHHIAVQFKELILSRLKVMSSDYADGMCSSAECVGVVLEKFVKDGL